MPSKSLLERPLTRASFLRHAATLATLSAFAFLDRSAFALSSAPRRLAASPLPHPDPRPNITADRVLAREQIGKRSQVIEAYEGARSYPAVFDGIACGCACGGQNPMHRSLLVCYETAQPTGCVSCQEEGVLVGRLAKDGKSLTEIRKAVDEKFG